MLPCGGGGYDVTASDEPGSSRSSDAPTAARGRTAKVIRTVAEIGAVAILSCVIVGSASVLRQEKKREAPPPANIPAEQPATRQAEQTATSQTEQPGTGETKPQDDGKARPWLRADPNPVLFGSEKGTTTITWDAAGASDAKIYLRGPDKEELFSGGSTGKETIDWIAPGGVYQFVLYADADRTQELATLKITRPAE